MDVKLVIFKQNGSTKEISVGPGRYVIGRRPDAGLRIPLPSVSRDHCELVHDGRSLSVRDLGSSNGTFKNQERVKQATLGPGDRLGVGSFTMTVKIDGKPATITRPSENSDEEDALIDTPPHGTMKPRAASPDDSDLEETISKSSSPPAMSGTKPTTDDSSIFEFDFDFEDDDRPKW
ncbi:MAG: FHA domain-containing protein [Phycisphaerae bacterium]|nr:FHA domain-containing protein [Phycisphaerae bacterium]